jgi:hypothetical protein
MSYSWNFGRGYPAARGISNKENTDNPKPVAAQDGSNSRIIRGKKVLRYYEEAA